MISYLSLVSNLIRDEGLLAFADALQSNKSIVRLLLERNPLQTEAITRFWHLLASLDLQRGAPTNVDFVSIGI